MNSENYKNLPELLSLNQTAKVLNVSPWTLRKWDNEGILKAVRIGTRKDRRYSREVIIQFIEKGTE